MKSTNGLLSLIMDMNMTNHQKIMEMNRQLPRVVTAVSGTMVLVLGLCLALL